MPGLQFGKGADKPMKRSELNRRLQDAIKFIDSMNLRLPPFAYWKAAEWAGKGSEYDEIRDNMLGWDITDFGSGDLDRVGLLLFTIRNGNAADKRYTKPYAEKLMIAGEGQVTPFHFHWSKMEDIIVRGGGDLMVQLYNSDADGGFASTPVRVSVDGRALEVAAGSIISLSQGESITLAQGQYHKFWGRPGAGSVLLGEVSMVNDDRTDNRFYEPAGRFPAIEEDEAPLYLLCTEYPRR
jgi:D-lyxose ketol-isomerase